MAISRTNEAYPCSPMHEEDFTYAEDGRTLLEDALNDENLVYSFEIYNDTSLERVMTRFNNLDPAEQMHITHGVGKEMDNFVETLLEDGEDPFNVFHNILPYASLDRFNKIMKAIVQ